MEIAFSLLPENRVRIELSNATGEGALLSFRHAAGRYVLVAGLRVTGDAQQRRIGARHRRRRPRPPRSLRFRVWIEARGRATIDYALVGTRIDQRLLVRTNRRAWRRHFTARVLL